MSKHNFSRRKFIKGGTYTTLAAGLSSAVGCGGSNGPFEMASQKQAVVIGSGFGGSVAALRLGEAGISTALLERGQRWVYNGPGSFPTLADLENGDPRTTWLSDKDATSGLYDVERYTGMLERVHGDTADSVCGAGLGGGSLVYGGVLLQPKQEYFELAMPHIDYAAMASVYYPRVLGRVSGGPIPDDILNNDYYAAKRVFIANAQAAGLEVVKSHVGFDWNIIRQELTGELPQAASTGDYVFSCNSGAKNTLDRNYIAAAEATGNVEVNTLHQVTTIKQRRAGDLYEVHCDILNTDGTIAARHVIFCQYVFMAAGANNTPKLLLKSKALGDLDGVNDAVGYGWAANGDELTFRVGVNGFLGPDSGIGPIQGGPPSIAAWDNNNSIRGVGFMHSPSPPRVGLNNTQVQMAMTISDETGHLTYNRDTDSVFINWPDDTGSMARQARLEALEKIRAESGGFIITDKMLEQLADQRITLWHPLGGAVMGQAVDQDNGELFGQPGIFVVDGACMPGSTGMANPSLTIAANAERMMENILQMIG